MANKNDVEIEKIHSRAEIVAQVFNLARIILICLAVLFALKICWEGLAGLIGANPDQLTAMAKIVEAFKLSTILHYLIDAVLLVTTGLSIAAARRATRQKAGFQSKLEQQDGNRTSSGLSPGGTTPSK
jgi:hypothetical protein